VWLFGDHCASARYCGQRGEPCVELTQPNQFPEEPAVATLKQLLTEYDKTHQKPTNGAIHMVCVPIIVWATVGIGWGLSNLTYGRWFSWELMPFINLGALGMVGMLAYYLRLSMKLFVSMLLVLAFTWLTLNAMHFAGWPILMISLVVWIAAWAGQFYGHHVEGAKPAFADDLVFLLIGPAFVLQKIFKRFGVSLVSPT